MVRPEISNWLNYWAVVIDKRTPKKVRKVLIKDMNAACLAAVEELIHNLQINNVPVTRSMLAHIKDHRKVLAKLADLKKSLKSKRALILRENGYRALAQILPALLKQIAATELSDSDFCNTTSRRWAASGMFYYYSPCTYV